MASFIPVYGSDINAARTMVDALSDVSSGALVPMADNLAQATPGKLFQDGTINVSALQAVADSLSDSSKAFKSANKKVQGIGDTHIAQVTELVDKAKDALPPWTVQSTRQRRSPPFCPRCSALTARRVIILCSR